jgi:hypothetical protein
MEEIEPGQDGAREYCQEEEGLGGVLPKRAWFEPALECWLSEVGRPGDEANDEEAKAGSEEDAVCAVGRRVDDDCRGGAENCGRDEEVTLWCGEWAGHCGMIVVR